MKNTTIKYLGMITLSVFCLLSCGKSSENTPDPEKQVPPAATWQENWFEHVQSLKLQYYNNYVAVYYDDDMQTDIVWPRRIATDVWKYTWDTYGGFGEDMRLKVILHADKYSGGHPAYYMDPSHGFNNVVDIGLAGNQWKDSVGQPLDILVHEIGHIVEGNSHATLNSPAFAIWGDSKWMEIYQYDIYKNLGWIEKADSWHNRMLAVADDFPRQETHWYRDWFYPIYNKHGETEVLARFFLLLSQHFPKQESDNGQEYTRDMNMGEFVHFWSGAAKADLKSAALTAFGPLDRNGNSWISQLDKAKVDFSQISY